MNTVEFEDIGYVVRVDDVRDFHMDFTVFQVWGKTSGGELVFEGEEGKPADGLDSAKRLLHGTVRWDGYSYLEVDDQLDFSDREEAVNLGVLLGRVYDLAAERIPNWENDS